MVATLVDTGRMVTESRAMVVRVSMAVIDGGYRDRMSEVVIGMMMILEVRYRVIEVVKMPEPSGVSLSWARPAWLSFGV